jgi:hypothetical protein
MRDYAIRAVTPNIQQAALYGARILLANRPLSNLKLAHLTLQ